MRKWFFLAVIFLLAACSANDLKSIDRVYLTYWENGGVTLKDEFYDDEEVLEIFINTVNNSEKSSGKVITTEPLLSFSFMIDDEIYKSFHLWLTDGNEAYIQELYPNEVLIFKIDNSSIGSLKNFFKEKEGLNLISGEIKFEK